MRNSTASIKGLLFSTIILAVAVSANAAVLVVTKTADTNDGVCDADCSLREAIVAAADNAGDDRIEFAAALDGQTIVLGSEFKAETEASQREFLIAELAGLGGDVSGTAEKLDVKESYLRRRLRTLEIPSD